MLDAARALLEAARAEAEQAAQVPAPAAELPTPELARRAVATGCVRYRMDTKTGLKDDCLFTYDLELPADFLPVAHDGEVAGFERWPVARVIARLREEPEAFKFNVPPVLVDFLLRHGLWTSGGVDARELARLLHG